MPYIAKSKCFVAVYLFPSLYFMRTQTLYMCMVKHFVFCIMQNTRKATLYLGLNSKVAW